MNYQEILNIMKRHSELLTKSFNHKMTKEEKQEFDELCNELKELSGDEHDTTNKHYSI